MPHTELETAALFARPDAAETIARLEAAAGDTSSDVDRDLAVELTALAVLRARAAAEADQ